MTTNGRRRTICLVAGDVSGDQNAGGLAAAIRELAPDVQLLGAGGSAMRQAGVDVVVETTAFSFMGVVDSLRMLREIISCYRRAQRLVTEARPDLVVLVDSETVNLPAAFWLRRRRVPAVFFFPPQVWLWGRWRLRSVVPLARRVLSAFREEADLYSAGGADTVWVGHPLCETVRVREEPAHALRAIGVDPARPLVVLMPGSRRNEIRALCGVILGAARLLQERDPALQFALPLAHESFRGEVEDCVRRSAVRDLVVYRPQSYAVLSQAQVIVQCSGTATVEAALLGIPSVIVYRCNRFEYLVARHLFMDVDFIGMPNILLGEMVQPEFFTKGADAEHLAQEAWSLLTDEHRRFAIQSRLKCLRDVLGPPGAFRRAAQAVVDLLPEYAMHEVTTTAEGSQWRPAVLAEPLSGVHNALRG